MKTIQQHRTVAATAVVALGLIFAVSTMAAQMVTSTPFQGPKANKGTVTMTRENGKTVLTLSDDFVVPDTPDPHWQLVDSKGTAYLLDRLKVKGDKSDRINMKITIPPYIKGVTKVVIWCAWAEANLGEATFKTPIS